MHINDLYEQQAKDLLHKLCDALGIEQEDRTRARVEEVVRELGKLEFNLPHGRTVAPSGAFMAYCECVDETIYLESKKAFANILISYGIPRDGDEVCLYAGENQEFACEMIVSHSVWHIEEQGRLMPTVYLRPRAGCTADAFRKIGWHEA